MQCLLTSFMVVLVVHVQCGILDRSCDSQDLLSHYIILSRGLCLLWPPSWGLQSHNPRLGKSKNPSSIHGRRKCWPDLASGAPMSVVDLRITHCRRHPHPGKQRTLYEQTRHVSFVHTWSTVCIYSHFHENKPYNIPMHRRGGVEGHRYQWSGLWERHRGLHEQERWLVIQTEEGLSG